MSHPVQRRYRFGAKKAVTLLSAGALAFAACGSGGSGSSNKAAASSGGTQAGSASSSSGLPPATTKDATLIKGLKKDAAAAALVPAAWRAKGIIKVATSASYAPDEFYASNNTTIVGWDPDLGHALAKTLGLNFDFVNVDFSEIIPGLSAHRYDLAMSSAGVEPPREKVINFVTDFTAGLAFMVQKSSSVRPTSLAGLCGLTVAAEQGSEEATSAQTEASACKKLGKKPLKLDVYPNQNDVNLALSSNRAQLAYADSPIVAYQVHLSNGKFIQVGGVYQAGPEGIEVPKGNDAMDRALQAGMNKLISSGVYAKILDNWGVQSGVITHSQIAPASGGSAR